MKFSEMFTQARPLAEKIGEMLDGADNHDVLMALAIHVAYIVDTQREEGVEAEQVIDKFTRLVRAIVASRVA